VRAAVGKRWLFSISIVIEDSGDVPLLSSWHLRRLGAQPLAGRIFHVAPEKQSQTSLNLTDVAFCAFFRCKGIAAIAHARPGQVAFVKIHNFSLRQKWPALRVDFHGQALLSVRSSRTLQAV